MARPLRNEYEGAVYCRARGSGSVPRYPAGARAHAEQGVADLNRVHPVLEARVTSGTPLPVHGEVTDPDVDVFDREGADNERVLAGTALRLAATIIS